MRKSLIAAGTSIMLGVASAHAQGIQITPAGTNPTQGIQITPAGTNPTLLGGTQNFIGHVAVDMKTAGDSGKHGSVGMVDFAPGARTAWHTHPIGQLLIITDGKGWVQEEGQPKREIKAGDVAWIEAGVKHWHGASPSNGMRHLAIAYIKDGKSADWKELVSDDQYNAR